jgi:hypothetical protein
MRQLRVMVCLVRIRRRGGNGGGPGTGPEDRGPEVCACIYPWPSGQEARPGGACQSEPSTGRDPARAPPPPGRGHNLTGPTVSPPGSVPVVDGFRVHASETVTTRPGPVPQLISGADVTGPRLG